MTPMRVLAWPAFRNRKDNPYNFLLYSHLQKLGVTVLDLGDMIRSPQQMWRVFWQGADILHIHWPEYALSLPFSRMLLHAFTLFVFSLWHRSRGGKVVWTVHNLSPHEDRYPFLEKWFYRALAHVVDGLIFLTETSRSLFQKDEKMRPFKDKPATIIPHGHYLPLYSSLPSRDEARKLLNLPTNSKIILFFGALRPYKGLEELLTVAKDLPSDGLLFLIAGRPLSEEYKRQLMGMVEGCPHVRFHPWHVPDEKVPLYFSSTDLVILPYRKILNSGTLFLALTFGVPTMAPQLGSLEELARRYPRLIHVYDPPLTKEKVIQALKSTRLPDPKQEQEWKNFLNEHDWGKVAEQTLHFYRTLANFKTIHPIARRF